ncbi:MAG: TIGR04282 family arsenosugar biosynthesis glycosyltransferase [Gudongella sp.]|nr:TIGR04282 family arsenosugar biosynthesis glycosyltransferase [Gudongella sp.]
MNALILMSRVPIPGKTKTRLMDILSGKECADLHVNFLRDLVSTFECLKENIDIYMTYAPENPIELIESIIPDFISCFPQEGQDLGDRMYNAISKVFSLGYEKVILIGSDVPQLLGIDILAAFNILEGCDLVLGPTYDGGYYLVGMNKAYKRIFSIDKKWGAKSVLEATIEIANDINLSVGLANKYRDIDTSDDLFKFIDKYRDNNLVAPNTINFLKEWREKDEIWINRNDKGIYKYK